MRASLELFPRCGLFPGCGVLEGGEDKVVPSDLGPYCERVVERGQGLDGFCFFT